MEKVKNRTRITTIIFLIVVGTILFFIDYSDLNSRDNYPPYIMAFGSIIGYIVILISGALKSDKDIVAFCKVGVIIISILLVVGLIFVIFFSDLIDNLFNRYVQMALGLALLIAMIQFLWKNSKSEREVARKARDIHRCEEE